MLSVSCMLYFGTCGCMSYAHADGQVYFLTNLDLYCLLTSALEIILIFLLCIGNNWINALNDCDLIKVYISNYFGVSIMLSLKSKSKCPFLR